LADDGHADIVSVRVDCAADIALDYLSDPGTLDKWALGMGETEVLGPNLVKGSYSGDGSDIYALIEKQENFGAIYYFLGNQLGQLTPRIMIRVVAGKDLDAPADSCVVSMIAWRLDSMDDTRWQDLVSHHEEEILLIKNLIEAR